MPSAPRSGHHKPSQSASTIVVDNVCGYHDLKIDGYLRMRALPNGMPLKSIPFTVGGQRWSIAFYPNGRGVEAVGFASVYLNLEEDVMAKDKKVMAQFQFAFLVERRDLFFRKRVEGVNSKWGSVRILDSHSPSGFPKFIERSDLEGSRGPIKNDSLTIRCYIIVFDNIRPEKAATAGATAPATSFVPLSDLHLHFADLLQTGKGADVAFQVGGETLAAHRCVLAARSPVFSAELFGTMKESCSSAGGIVRVDDMEAEVFKALLCFLYTDSLPKVRKEDEHVMYQHLLVAADRYGIERLKLICEDKLCKYIDVEKVATVLTLAEQHNCHWLRKACLDFLSTPANLKAVMASDGFEHLSSSCPSLKTALVAMLSS
ncbi:unnamed protein product [Urochloa humidicola]